MPTVSILQPLSVNIAPKAYCEDKDILIICKPDKILDLCAALLVGLAVCEHNDDV